MEAMVVVAVDEVTVVVGPVLLEEVVQLREAVHAMTPNVRCVARKAMMHSVVGTILITVIRLMTATR